MIFDFKLLTLGFGIGLLAVLPVGPVNVMAINRALRGGVPSGFAVGVGSTLADILFALIALYGIKTLSVFFMDHMVGLQIVGAMILSGIGVYLLRKPPQDLTPGSGVNGRAPTVVSGFISGFLLTITNPGPLIYFASAFSPLGLTLGTDAGFVRSLSLLCGVGLGALFWWATLSGSAGVFHRQINPRTMKRINSVSGGVMLLLALFLLASAVLGIDLQHMLQGF